MKIRNLTSDYKTPQFGQVFTVVIAFDFKIRQLRHILSFISHVTLEHLTCSILSDIFSANYYFVKTITKKY